MDDPNRRGYHPGEERFYPGGGKAGTPPPRKPGRRLFAILAAAVGMLLVIVVVMAVVLVHMVTTPQAKGSTVQSTSATAQSSTAATSASPQATVTPTAAVPTPTSTSGAVLPCNVNVGTWTGGSSDWKTLNGVLLNDGTNNDSVHGPTLIAPCQLGNTTDYTVKTTIQVTPGQQYVECFGISVRGTSVSSGWQGYLAGDGRCSSDLTTAYLGGPGYSNDTNVLQAPFAPGTTSHTYQVQAKGNVITFSVDSSVLLTLTDNRYLTGSEVGLWCFGVQLQVTSFAVTAA